MTYKEMVSLAQERGHGNEAMMHESVEHISEMLCSLKKHDPEAYWRFMREQHAILYHHHYSPEFADWDVEQLTWMGRDGEQHHGPHWSKEQVTEATKGMPFPTGTTDCDKYVAFNTFYSDLCQELDEASILKLGHRFFFMDFDAPEGKIWRYSCAMREIK